MARISADARRELVQAIGERYRSGSRAEKLLILDEFVAVTGYHRKHSIRLLRARPRSPGSARRPRLRGWSSAQHRVIVDDHDKHDVPPLAPLRNAGRHPSPRSEPCQHLRA